MASFRQLFPALSEEEASEKLLLTRWARCEAGLKVWLIK